MLRRNFMASGLVTGAMVAAARPARAQGLSGGQTPVRPAMLRRGDKVGIVAPSSPLDDPATGRLITDAVQALGLVPVLSAHVLNRSRDYATSVRERLSDLHGMFADPSIKGVFCANGGYGTSEIVADIDYDLIARNPKVFLGFSDITLLHLAIARRTGLVTFHGHMVGQKKFPPYSLEALRRAVCSKTPLGLLHNPPEPDQVRPQNPLRTIRSGQAMGRLVGGNLSLIMAAMGTPWEIDTRGAILVIEDVDESPYSMARMMHTLRHAGKLSQAAGIVVGACVNSEKRSDVSPYTLNEAFDQVLGDLGRPVFQGLLLGHTDEQMTLPLGVQARMDAGACTLDILESGVV